MYEYKATVLNVVDGDTVDLKISLGFHTYIEVRCRLFGIDTPELHDPDPALRNAAQVAKAFVIAKLADPAITIQSSKPFAGDKYGRWLVKIVNAAGENINDALLAAGLAKPFMAG